MITNKHWLLPLALLVASPAQAGNTSLEAIIQDVINHYPALKTAYIQTAKAQQENIKIRGMLGWQLGVQAGVAKEVSLFGQPVDQLTTGASLSRQLESGDRMSVSANIAYEDADESLIPTLPNPATSTDIKFEYIKPLGKGAGNVEYLLGLASAEASTEISKASQQDMLDKLAAQLIELYLGMVSTAQQIENTELSIKRTEKLQAFINSRYKLGIAENKDQLQTRAQLEGQKAQLVALELAWTQQQIGVNRLTGQPWHRSLSFKEPVLNLKQNISTDKILEQAKQHSPLLAQTNSLIAIAENQIKLERNSGEDTFDLKFYIGNKTTDGDSTAGNVSNSDVVAGVGLEYRQSLDHSASNAALYQAQLERGLQLQTKKQALQDLQYDVASLIAEIDVLKRSINAYRSSLKAEKEKLADAEERYRSGRIDIDKVIQFENQMSQTELALKLQKIELHKRLLKLSLKTGALWKNITLPVFDFENDDSITGDAS